MQLCGVNLFSGCHEHLLQTMDSHPMDCEAVICLSFWKCWSEVFRLSLMPQFELLPGTAITLLYDACSSFGIVIGINGDDDGNSTKILAAAD